MKLKKIASLMLAGVMAVSMLAGCSNTAVDPEPTPDPDPVPATGSSITLGEEVGVEKDFITFADNADDVAALQDALGNLSSTGVYDSARLPKTVTPVTSWNPNKDMKLVVSDFAESAEITNTRLGAGLMKGDLLYFFNKNADKTMKYGLLFVVDGTVEDDKALAQIADMIKDDIAKLPNVNVSFNDRYTYDYTVSASVVNKALEPFAGYTVSADFIAVTVTRVPTAA